MNVYKSGCKNTHALIADERNGPIINHNKTLFRREQGAGFRAGDRFPAPLFREIPDNSGYTSANNDLFHAVTVRHFVEEGEMTIRNEWGTEMISIDLVDKRDISGKCRAGISRGSYRNTSGLCPAGTLLCKDRNMTAIAPAQQDLPKI